MLNNNDDVKSNKKNKSEFVEQNIIINSAEKSKKKYDEDNSSLAKFFKFAKFNTTLKKEIIGGISTLLAMIYILSVEPSILSGASSVADQSVKMNAQGVFLSTAIVSFIATLLMGLSSNVPVALAPSMGINAMFTYSVASKGIGFEGALMATTISSILFCIISITNVRKILIKALPKSLHIAIGLGIGFFIAYVGIKNIGWVAESRDGLPKAALSDFKQTYIGIILGTVVVFAAIVLHYKKFIAPVAIMMLAGFIIAVIIANVVPKGSNSAVDQAFSTARWKSDGWDYNLLWNGFVHNLKETYTNAGNKAIWTSPTMYVSIFVFTILTFFDATGTLTSVNVIINKNREKPTEIPKAAMIIDGGTSIAGSLVGISHMAVYAESCVGISQGARTGFASVITSLGLLLSIALFPIFGMIPDCITGAATLFIGIIMIGNITEIEWKKPEIALSSFFIILFMIITYNIAIGICLGLFAYTIGCLANKKSKEISPVIWIFDVIFLVCFVAMAFVQ
ncbi:xanthine/uracil permease [Spiroplasma helicoides]|uniref:Xanthine/uracil permease n=1 Tax=Spiroplasma helicoides TaxID=216938 RepID=A0A1B3SL38_9MOLU|nr:NCS2 family permease [Spiroplasma helicoides]AOG60651.1 xanthine/uracil permease [Spiroplasma helicoides]